MIIPQFPDLLWLKRQIEQRFKDHIGYNGIRLETDGFPSVIINAKVKESYRPDVTGPISLFMNMKGTSRCTVENHTTVIPEDYFFVSNRFQPYTLEIESEQPVETFNVHMGEYFSEQVLSALITPTDIILQNGDQQKGCTVNFQNQLYRKTETFKKFVQQLKETNEGEKLNQFLFQEVMTNVLRYLLLQHREIVKTIQSLPSVKQSTRIELYKRLSIAVDYLHSSIFEKEVDLDKLAAVSCLSKYHLIRLFKQVYGLSPYQYLQQLRLEKAKSLLKDSALSVQSIADILGFENSNSFSRLFYQRMKIYPAVFRTGAN